MQQSTPTSGNTSSLSNETESQQSNISSLQDKSSLSNGVIEVERAQLDNVIVRRNTAGVYLDSANALDCLPAATAALQKFGLLNAPVSNPQAILSTADVKIGTLSLEENCAQLIIDGRKTSPKDTQATSGNVKSINQYNANLMIIMPSDKNVEFSSPSVAVNHHPKWTKASSP